MTNEPLNRAEAIRGVLLAALAVLQVFDVVHLTAEQNGALLALYVAVSVALTSFARARVTPTSKVALTHDDVTLLNAGRTTPTYVVAAGGGAGGGQPPYPGGGGYSSIGVPLPPYPGGGGYSSIGVPLPPYPGGGGAGHARVTNEPPAPPADPPV